MRRRILVIDDEPSVTDGLRLVLTELGHHIDVARSGGEAKELLKGSPYDLWNRARRVLRVRFPDYRTDW